MVKDTIAMDGGMIPKSVLAGVVKDSIKTQSDEKIAELTDILYSGFSRWDRHESRLEEQSARIDRQHIDIVTAIESMKAGFDSMERRFEAIDRRFEAVDKRFDDLIHQMDKRFEGVDRRFTMLTWLIGISFVVINLTIVALKVF